MNNVMNYAILRVQKLKTNTAVRGSLKHAFRTQNTPNADPDKLDQNTHIGANSVEEAMEVYKNLLPEKVRKNGVRAVEYLMTASPDKMGEMTTDEQNGYFSDALEWLKEKHGAQNVVYSGIHRDESTPHMYAYVVPIDEKGKLNCRKFLGGTKHVLSELQDEFAEQVGKPHGLDRGLKGSKAKHQTIKQYYAKLDKAVQNKWDIQKPRMLKKGLLINKVEKKEDIIDRLAEQVAGLSRSSEEKDRSISHASRTLKSLESQLKKLEPIQDLTKKDREKILDMAKAERLKRKKQNNHKEGLRSKGQEER